MAKWQSVRSDQGIASLRLTGATALEQNSISDPTQTGPRSAVGNVSGNRCESDCRSMGCEFDPGPVPYFRGD